MGAAEVPHRRVRRQAQRQAETGGRRFVGSTVPDRSSLVLAWMPVAPGVTRPTIYAMKEEASGQTVAEFMAYWKPGQGLCPWRLTGMAALVPGQRCSKLAVAWVSRRLRCFAGAGQKEPSIPWSVPAWRQRPASGEGGLACCKPIGCAQ